MPRDTTWAKELYDADPPRRYGLTVGDINSFFYAAAECCENKFGFGFRIAVMAYNYGFQRGQQYVKNTQRGA